MEDTEKVSDKSCTFSKGEQIMVKSIFEKIDFSRLFVSFQSILNFCL